MKSFCLLTPGGSRAAQRLLHRQPFASPHKATFLLCPPHPNLIAGLSCISFPSLRISSLPSSQKQPCPSPPRLLLAPLSFKPCLASQALCSCPPPSFSCSPPRTSLQSLISHCLILTNPSPILPPFSTTSPLLLNTVPG